MTVEARGPFLAWPGWPHLRRAWWLTALVSLWFAVVYVGADHLTATRTARLHVHLDAELQIPLLPSFTLVYMSIYALFLFAPFVLRTRRELTTLAVAQSVCIFIAGIGFILIPGQLAYAPPSDAELGVWKSLFHFADWLNLDYNLVPSLHVALSVVSILLFARQTASAGRILLGAWAGLIAIATLVTHQHHLVDVVSGWLLALAVVHWVRQYRH